ncbi:hypothetical protein [Carnobacterium maltaromaticum]|uniref:hypothetical protein n=1 Tax=Carnobacterium maltaromaticum TaxID=2751 RepID=UPI00191BABB5|nr:hypothetical protein [Carnobacterium maltaromaticum]CAD5898187.1 conserved hypothetical protein [Carnobacterium maltaromaticum]
MHHYEKDYAEFTGNVLCEVIENVNYIKGKYKKESIPISFDFTRHGMVINDKLSYILFECFCYHLIKNENRRVRISWAPKKEILTEGVFKSSLVYLNKKYDKNKFLTSFQENISYEEDDAHFRKVFKSPIIKDEYYLSKMQVEISIFFSTFNLSETSKNELIQVCSELIGNTIEHTNSDCLVDIDVTTSHSKYNKNKEKQDGKFYGINVAIVNFSDKLLYNDVKEKIVGNDFEDPRYIDIIRAHRNHSGVFTGEESKTGYTEEHFWCLASMQFGISGRKNTEFYGGTGFHIVLKSLIEKSEMNNCYVISGDTIIQFKENLIIKKMDQDLVGFNKSNDFIKDVPDKEILKKCSVFIPGTAYNLNFIMENEEENNERDRN